ncbi:MAG TPA: hypothetical protein VGI96_01355 [Streptosporangiaceae bacterium]|jgi:hypothetical protein
MAVIVLASPGGSPGVTTTALALALSWPREVILAECDPAGGAILAGLWRGQSVASGAGLIRLALAAQKNPAAAAAAMGEETLPLAEPPSDRMVLPTPPGPAPGRRIAAAWPALAAAFATAEPDVIADAGRLDDTTALGPLLAGAAHVLLVCRPLIRQAAAARPRLEILAQARAARPAAALLVVGEGPYGMDAPKVLTDALGIPVRASLPSDPAAAAVLSDGTTPRRGFARSPLMRAAAILASGLAREVAARPAPAAASLPAGAR